ncbi:hypothetical protein W97_06541 [Coniosporium apollinis CBS 100218]|uniref:Uncharacterized protein n=1 Tax=Coniosporium apollinis (strain CBS 100218) TaxID=1168221 RepID=R7YZM2_CONA1|nr:uncharacterized protein W97_06541 [Coniosporium apollinis CBS 100218]EON67288.1 hypothetical protein W97_06541 [Coniosporium apollinis CBS 100218]
MAQGAVKKAAKPAGVTKSQRTQRGARVIAPKKVKLIQQQKLVKKHTSGLTALTEKNLAEKAGHLELLRGGKKDKKGGKGAERKGEKGEKKGK